MTTQSPILHSDDKVIQIWKTLFLLSATTLIGLFLFTLNLPEKHALHQPAPSPTTTPSITILTLDANP